MQQAVVLSKDKNTLGLFSPEKNCVLQLKSIVCFFSAHLVYLTAWTVKDFSLPQTKTQVATSVIAIKENSQHPMSSEIKDALEHFSLILSTSQQRRSFYCL